MDQLPVPLAQIAFDGHSQGRRRELWGAIVMHDAVPAWLQARVRDRDLEALTRAWDLAVDERLLRSLAETLDAGAAWYVDRLAGAIACAHVACAALAEDPASAERWAREAAARLATETAGDPTAACGRHPRDIIVAAWGQTAASDDVGMAARDFTLELCGEGRKRVDRARPVSVLGCGPSGFGAHGMDGFVAGIAADVVANGSGRATMHLRHMLFTPCQPAFVQAVDLAFRLSCRRHAWLRRDQDVRWWMRGVEGRVLDDASVGLGAAVMFDCLARGHRPDHAVAVTGTVTAKGTVGGVAGLDLKIKAAVQHRMRRVLVPHEDSAAAAVSAGGRIEVGAVDSIEAAVESARPTWHAAARRSGVGPGKRAWVQIKDPRGDDGPLFRESEHVYRRLFNPEHVEPWSNFEIHIGATGGSDRHYYLVGTIGGVATGMAFVTTYASLHLAFMSYFGVRGSETLLGQRLAGDFFMVLDTVLRGDQIEVVLFECEKARPHDAERDPWVAGRLRLLHDFQRRGARKLGGVHYVQPPLEVDDPAQDNLHLMAYQMTNEQPSVDLARADVARYVDFVYNRFYADCFRRTHPHRDAYVRAALARLATETMAGIPEAMTRTPFVDVRTRPFPLRVFLSADDGSGLLVRVIEDVLLDEGVDVVVRDRPSGARDGGADPRAASCDAVLGIFNDRASMADVCADLEAAARAGGAPVVVVSARTPTDVLTALRLRLSSVVAGAGRQTTQIYRAGHEYPLALTIAADLARIRRVGE